MSQRSRAKKLSVVGMSEQREHIGWGWH